MKIKELIQFLEQVAPPSYQESYDNSGLIVGNENTEISQVLLTLDCTEEVIAEAMAHQCQLVIAHHPIVFKGLKKLNGKNYVERTVIKAIQNNIAIYAIHTNLDHVMQGVNAKFAQKLGLINTRILAPKTGELKKLVTFSPSADAEKVKNALFAAGAGQIGNYSECSFSSEGKGSFKASDKANPYVGNRGERHQEPEIRLELMYPKHLERAILMALWEAHPYEEVAYYCSDISNVQPEVGAGMVGFLAQPMEGKQFLQMLKNQMQAQVIRHTALLPKSIHKVAICGGAGSFLLPNAIAAGADIFVTADYKYHEFFDAENRIVIADIGHFETEHFTAELLLEIIRKKFANFAVRLSEINTNPINYFI